MLTRSICRCHYRPPVPVCLVRSAGSSAVAIKADTQIRRHTCQNAPSARPKVSRSHREISSHTATGWSDGASRSRTTICLSALSLLTLLNRQLMFVARDSSCHLGRHRTRCERGMLVFEMPMLLDKVSSPSLARCGVLSLTRRLVDVSLSANLLGCLSSSGVLLVFLQRQLLSPHSISFSPRLRYKDQHGRRLIRGVVGTPAYTQEVGMPCAGSIRGGKSSQRPGY